MLSAAASSSIGGPTQLSAGCRLRFQFPIQTEPIEYYVTIAQDATSSDGGKPATEERGNHSLESIARLRPGLTMAQAQADLSTIAARLAQQYPDTNTAFGALVKPL